jgi:hypothetical protein
MGGWFFEFFLKSGEFRAYDRNLTICYFFFLKSSQFSLGLFVPKNPLFAQKKPLNSTPPGGWVLFHSILLLKWRWVHKYIYPIFSILKTWKHKILSTLSYCRQLWLFWLFYFNFFKNENFRQNYSVLKIFFANGEIRHKKTKITVRAPPELGNRFREIRTPESPSSLPSEFRSCESELCALLLPSEKEKRARAQLWDLWSRASVIKLEL